jgi:DNA-binding MarR family transcriptional regulator
VQLPDELLDHADAIEAFRTLNRVRSVVGGIIGRQVEQQEGIPFEWFEVLIAIADTPEETLRIGDLASLTLRSKSAMTRLADRIEAAELIRRDASATDRRVIFVTLTDKGQALIERVKSPIAKIMVERFTSHISPADARFVTRVLTKLLVANGVDSMPGLSPDQSDQTAAVATVDA